MKEELDAYVSVLTQLELAVPKKNESDVEPVVPEATIADADALKKQLEQLQAEGEVFLSNAVLEGDYVLRACIVNFRTTLRDVQALPEIVVRAGEAQHRAGHPIRSK